MPEVMLDVAEEQVCTTGAPHALILGQPAAVFSHRREGFNALEDADLVNGDEGFMEDDDDDMDDSLDDMDSFVPGLRPPWHVSKQASHCRVWSVSGMLHLQARVVHKRP